MNSKYLEHHGIKGQRWGVENGPPYPLGSVTKAIAYKGGRLDDGSQVNFTKKDLKKARKTINKNPGLLSPEELLEYKQRLIMEEDINKITGVGKGKKAVEDVLTDIGTEATRKAGKQLLANAEIAVVRTALASVLGDETAQMIVDGLRPIDFEDRKEKKIQSAHDRKMDKRKQDELEEENKFKRSEAQLKREKDAEETEYNRKQTAKKEEWDADERNYQRRQDAWNRQKDSINYAQKAEDQRLKRDEFNLKANKAEQPDIIPLKNGNMLVKTENGGYFVIDENGDPIKKQK